MTRQRHLAEARRAKTTLQATYRHSAGTQPRCLRLIHRPTLENGRKTEQTGQTIISFGNSRLEFRHLTKFALLPLLAALVLSGPAASQGCRAISPQGEPPYFAENYPLPLSLRSNLILLMKEEMAARGEYNASLSSAVFTTLLENQLKRAQARLGHEVTGCITWALIQAYDSQGRTPPPEAGQ